MAKIARILALTGGGMKGIIEARFLQRFCLQAGIQSNELWKYFDIICGTSIGGIQAIGLASGMGADEFVDLFYNDGPYIFTTDPNVPSQRVDTKGKVSTLLQKDDAFYQNTYLKQRLEDKIGAETLMNQLRTNVLVTSWNRTQSKINILSNIFGTQFYDLYGANYKAVDCALATSAAPLYLPPANINGDELIDGGVFQNNPSTYGYTVAEALYPTADKYCILSLGCGVTPTQYIDVNQLGKDSANNIFTWLKDGFDWITNISIDNIQKLFQLIEIAMAGSQEASTHTMGYLAANPLNRIFHYHFDFPFNNPEDTEMDISDSAHLDHLTQLTYNKYNNIIEQSKILNFIGHLAL